MGADAKLNYFWHQEDDYTLTSQGYIWTYPGKSLTSNSVMVLPEQTGISFEICKNLDCYGICSKFVDSIKYQISNVGLDSVS